MVNLAFYPLMKMLSYKKINCYSEAVGQIFTLAINLCFPENEF